MMKRNPNISSFDEFYNKQMAASKLSNTSSRQNSNTNYDNCNNSNFQFSLYPANKAFHHDVPFGARSVSVDRSTLRRPYTSSSLSNSINKLDEHAYNRPPLGKLNNDYFPSSHLRPSSLQMERFQSRK